jgi:hypothetical protein
MKNPERETLSEKFDMFDVSVILIHESGVSNTFTTGGIEAGRHPGRQQRILELTCAASMPQCWERGAWAPVPRGCMRDERRASP